MSGPFVVIDNAVLRKACAWDPADPRGVLRFATEPTGPTRFDTREDATEAIATTCARLGWLSSAYQVVPLAEWEEEQLSPGRRRKKATAPAHQEPSAGDDA